MLSRALSSAMKETLRLRRRVCRSGFRAHLALRTLKELGFADVVNVTGGWLSMQAEGGLETEES